MRTIAATITIECGSLGFPLNIRAMIMFVGAIPRARHASELHGGNLGNVTFLTQQPQSQ